ncbi:MAG: hypothetical protein ACYDHN_14785 [Solirubrobacteraceae bacterium]
MEQDEGSDYGREVEHDARPEVDDGHDGLVVFNVSQPGSRRQVGMRVFDCHEQRMLRALHGRWPYRRSHCRHDLHWLVRVREETCFCSSARTHSVSGLRVHSRRPKGA